MSASPADIAAMNTDPGMLPHPLRVLPGGRGAIPEEWVAAGILLFALGGLWAIRRHLGREGRTMASGTAAIVFVFYYLIATAVVRIAAAHLAARGDTAAARGVAFFA